MEGDVIENDDVNDDPTLEVPISVEISIDHIALTCLSTAFPSMQDEQGVSTHENDEQGLSTHEKERLKMRAKIEQMEKASLEPSPWLMKGEVTDIMFCI
jgi:U3 small nucleolar ribonucleoprotein component